MMMKGLRVHMRTMMTETKLGGGGVGSSRLAERRVGRQGTLRVVAVVLVGWDVMTFGSFVVRLYSRQRVCRPAVRVLQMPGGGHVLLVRQRHRRSLLA